jgi:hypothetical protein
MDLKKISSEDKMDKDMTQWLWASGIGSVE